MAEVWRAMEPDLRAKLEAGEITQEVFDKTRARFIPETTGALAEVTRLVPEDIVAEVGNRQRARERTLIFDSNTLRTHRLADFRAAAEAGAQHGAARVLQAAEKKVAECGFSDFLVVENFPVALVAYGYTRLARTPEGAILRAFPNIKFGRARDKTPVYIAESDTEAVFFELDAIRVLRWLDSNELLDMPELPEEPEQARIHAKAAVMTAAHTIPAVAEWVYELQHTIAHALIRNVGERSGFAENTLAEYLIPDLLTIGIFAATHQEFTLGALVSLAEHRLSEWLDATLDGVRSCDWDPYCARDQGACMGCLHLPFGCDAFNGSLDRALLIGSPARAADGREVARGYWQ